MEGDAREKALRAALLSRARAASSNLSASYSSLGASSSAPPSNDWPTEDYFDEDPPPPPSAPLQPALAYQRDGKMSLRRVNGPGVPPPPQRGVAAQPSRTVAAPPKAAAPRHVSVPSNAFASTSNGMALVRKHGAAADAPAAAPAALSVNFKRRRLADAAREAKRSGVLCTYFCKRGVCTNRECQFEHDLLRVAVCQDFLHNGCNPAPGADCLLSHTLAPERMPVCRLFTRGLCVDANCPFPHVHLSSSAGVCEAFSRRGYCEAGASCGKRHELLCAAYAASGTCPLGDKCRLGRR